MTRQSISLSEPNNEWLKNQLESEEYSSKSELVNDLIRQARKREAQMDWLAAELKKGRESGYVSVDREDMIERIKSSVGA